MFFYQRAVDIDTRSGLPRGYAQKARRLRGHTFVHVNFFGLSAVVVIVTIHDHERCPPLPDQQLFGVSAAMHYHDEFEAIGCRALRSYGRFERKLAGQAVAVVAPFEQAGGVTQVIFADTDTVPIRQPMDLVRWIEAFGSQAEKQDPRQKNCGDAEAYEERMLCSQFRWHASSWGVYSR